MTINQHLFEKWHRPIGDKYLSEQMMATFTEAYKRHSASMI